MKYRKGCTSGQKVVHYELVIAINYIFGTIKEKGKEVMNMKKVSEFVAKIVDRNIKKEVDSACMVIGYQPVVPDSAKKFKNRK